VFWGANPCLLVLWRVEVTSFLGSSSPFAPLDTESEGNTILQSVGDYLSVDTLAQHPTWLGIFSKVAVQHTNFRYYITYNTRALPCTGQPVHTVYCSKSCFLHKYRVIQKDGPNFIRLYFLNYTWYVNDPHNIWKSRS